MAEMWQKRAALVSVFILRGTTFLKDFVLRLCFGSITFNVWGCQKMYASLLSSASGNGFAHKNHWACVRACFCNPLGVLVWRKNLAFMPSESHRFNIPLQPMRGHSLLLGSCVCPPHFPWSWCHTSSLIESQISMSPHSTPGPRRGKERQHSYWFCRSISTAQFSQTHKRVVVFTIFKHTSKVIQERLLLVH